MIDLRTGRGVIAAAVLIALAWIATVYLGCPIDGYCP